VPNSLQYPLERERDLERRWQRLLQRTATAKHPVAVASKYLRAPSPRFDVPISAAWMEENAEQRIHPKR
jgi:hypothetical protein